MRTEEDRGGRGTEEAMPANSFAGPSGSVGSAAAGVAAGVATAGAAPSAAGVAAGVAAAGAAAGSAGAGEVIASGE